MNKSSGAAFFSSLSLLLLLFSLVGAVPPPPLQCSASRPHCSTHQHGHHRQHRHRDCGWPGTPPVGLVKSHHRRPDSLCLHDCGGAGGRSGRYVASPDNSSTAGKPPAVEDVDGLGTPGLCGELGVLRSSPHSLLGLWGTGGLGCVAFRRARATTRPPAIPVSRVKRGCGVTPNS